MGIYKYFFIIILLSAFSEPLFFILGKQLSTISLALLLRELKFKEEKIKIIINQ